MSSIANLFIGVLFLPVTAGIIIGHNFLLRKTQKAYHYILPALFTLVFSIALASVYIGQGASPSPTASGFTEYVGPGPGPATYAQTTSPSPAAFIFPLILCLVLWGMLVYRHVQNKKSPAAEMHKMTVQDLE